MTASAWIRDEAHAAAILLECRKKQYKAARAAFTPDEPHSNARLLDAALKLIDAYEKRDAYAR